AWRSKDAAGGDVRFDHATTGFPLTGQHMRASCVSCHNSSVPLKRACVSCHEDFHRGRLSQACDNCHLPAGWKVTQPLKVHRMTQFPLTGMHVLADCTQCHVRASEQKFTDAPVECYGCHQQDYQRPGIFPHTGSATSAPLPRQCNLCHRAVAWVPATVPASLSATTGSPLQTQAAPPPGHDLRFPISFGSHRVAACSDCHASLSAPRSVRCVGCHAHDPVLLTQQHKRPMATDGASCLSCHPGGVRR
ncbi:MAG TPA: cytochrome c3 family protein, partial [Polyangiaceae bacterium]